MDLKYIFEIFKKLVFAFRGDENVLNPSDGFMDVYISQNVLNFSH